MAALLALRVEWGALPEAAYTIGLAAPLCSLCLLWLSVPLRALQWRILLPQAAFARLLRAQFIGLAGNVLVPFRGGELMRAVAATGGPVRFEAALLTSALTRLQDVPAIIALAITGYLLHGSAGPTALWVGGLVSLMGFALYPLALRSLGAARRRIVASRPIKAGWTRWLLDRVADSIASMPNLPTVLLSQCFAMPCWLIFAIAPVPIFIAAGLPPMEAFYASAVFTVATSLSQLLPISPAGVGTFHAVGVIVLQRVAPGLSPEMLLTVVTVNHLVGSVGVALPGFIVLFRASSLGVPRRRLDRTRRFTGL